jgi:hypothetical protein
MSLIGCTINLKVKHWGGLNSESTPSSLQYSMVLIGSWIPDSGKSGMGTGMEMDPPIPGKSGMGMGMGIGGSVPCLPAP